VFKADVVHPLMEKVAALLKRRNAATTAGASGP
jgi:hypothetical protein